MTVSLVGFRLTMYAPRSAQPDPDVETTVLTPRAGALHSDPFRITTLPGVTEWKPYLQRPNGRKGRVDFRAKKTDTGSMSVTVQDPRVDLTSTGNAGRWLTQYYGDEGARPAMLRCLVRIEITLDGGVTWAPWWTGRVDDVKQKEKLEFTLALKDLNDDLTQEIFLNDPASTVTYARRAEMYPYALTQDFGDLEKNRDPMLAATDTEGAGYRLGFATENTSAVQWRLITQQLRDLATDVKRRIENLTRVREIYSIRRGDLKARLRDFDPDTGNGPLIGEFWITKIEADFFDGQWRMRWAWIEQDNDLNSPAFPADNTAVHVIFLRTGPASESGPILIDDIHPATYLRDLFAGKFGILNTDGSPRYPAPMRESTFAAIAADPTFPLIRKIQTESSTLKAEAQEICQESQIAYYVDARGRIGLVDMRRATSIGTSLELTDADLISDPGSAVPTQASSEAIVHVIVAARKYEILDPVEDQIFEKDGDRYPSVPAAALRIIDYQDEYFALGDVRTLDFNSKPLDLNLKSIAAPVIGQDTVSDIGRSDFERRRAFQSKVVDDLFAMFSHGASYFTLKCRRTATVQAIDVGTRALASCSALANVISNLRGGTRIGICIERSEDEDTIILGFADLGATEQADPPSLGAPSVDEDDCAHVAHLPVTLNAEGDPVRVDIAIVPIGGDQPEPSSPLWEFAGTVFATTADFVTSNLAPESYVYFRARSEPRAGSSLRLPSEWVFPTPAFIETCPAELIEVDNGPQIAALFCLIPSAQSIGVQASDTSYRIQVQRADDADGTNTVELTGSTGVVGTTTQVDDTVADGETKYYRARLLLEDGDPAGPWTEWIACTAEVDGEPPPPAVILPVITDTPSQTDTTAILDVEITDPQLRFIDLAFARTSAPDFALDDAPYHAEEPLLPGTIVTITRKVRYYDGLGQIVESVRTFEYSVPSDDPPDEPPTPDARGGTPKTEFHASLHMPVEIPKELLPGDEAWYEVSTVGRRRADLSGAVTGRVLYDILSALDFLGEGAIQFVPASNLTPLEEDWDFCEGDAANAPIDGPVFPLTEETEVPNEAPFRLRVEARADVILRVVARRQAGTLTDDCRIRSLEIEWQGGFSIPQPPEQPLPPTDPCVEGTTEFSEDFSGYTDDASLAEDWDIWTPPFYTAGGVLEFDPSGGPTGGPALKFTAPTTVVANNFGSHIGPRVERLIEDLASAGDEVRVTGKCRIDIPNCGFSADSGPINLALIRGDRSNGAYSADVVDNNTSQDMDSGNLTLTGDGSFYISYGWGNITFFSACQAETWLTDLTLYVNGEKKCIIGGEPEDGGGDPGFPPEDPGGGSDDVPDTPATGIRALTLWGYYEPLWGDYPPFQGGVFHRGASGLIDLLDEFRSRGWRFWLIPVGNADMKVGGVFSINKWLASIAEYDGMQATLATYTDVMVGIMLLDEPFRTDRWGPNGIPWATTDLVMAKRCKELFPGFPRAVRLDCTDMERTGLRNPQYITSGWDTWLVRKGDPATFMTRARASSNRLGFKNHMWGINPRPTSGLLATAAQYRSVGIMMAKDATSLGVAVWNNIPTDTALSTSTWQAAGADIVAAMVQP
jgi:hypothetical protein